MGWEWGQELDPHPRGVPDVKDCLHPARQETGSQDPNGKGEAAEEDEDSKPEAGEGGSDPGRGGGIRRRHRGPKQFPLP